MMRAGCDIHDLLDIVADELQRRNTPADLAAYLNDRRTLGVIDDIHQRAPVAMRAALEDHIAAAKARVRQEGTIPCPI